MGKIFALGPSLTGSQVMLVAACTVPGDVVVCQDNVTKAVLDVVFGGVGRDVEVIVDPQRANRVVAAKTIEVRKTAVRAAPGNIGIEA